MSSSRSFVRSLRTSSTPSRSLCNQCIHHPHHRSISTISSRNLTHPTNHQRPAQSTSSSSSSSSLSSLPRSIIPSIQSSQQTRNITRPALQQVQQQPLPENLTSPPPGYRMNKIHRPFVPVSTHQRKPYAVNESLEVLNEMYIKLLGEGGDKALTEEVKWQCVTHKSFDHGLQPFNLKLAFYGRRIAYLHSTLSLIHRDVPTNSADPTTPKSATPSIPNDPSLPLPAISKRNPINAVSYSRVSDYVNSANFFGIAKACGLVSCLRWKPRNSGNLIESGVEKISEEAIFAILGAISLQKGGDAARRVMEERILPGAKVVQIDGEGR